MSAGTKWRDQGQALTNWRAEDAVCQQTQNGGTEGRHSQAEEQRTQCVRGAEQRDQGQALMDWRVDDVVCQQVQNGGIEGRQLTFWRAEDAVCQQVQNGWIEGRHSPAGEQRMWCIGSRCKTEGLRAGTHFLNSKGCGVSASAK
jgi:hypothetical protein